MIQAIHPIAGKYNQLCARISSFDQKQARSRIPQRESIPQRKVVLVTSICFLKPPIKAIF
jgi:hypothetical protein